MKNNNSNRNNLVVIKNNNSIANNERQLSNELYEVSDIITRFLSGIRTDKTRVDYGDRLEYFFSYLSECTQVKYIAHINEHHITDYIIHMENVRQLSSNTINAYIVTLSSFFKWAQDHSLIVINPTIGYKRKLPKRNTVKQADALTSEEAKEMLTSFKMNDIKEITEHLALSLMFNLGLRASEAMGIKLRDFEVISNQLVLNIKSKGGKINQMPINNYLKDSIRFYTDFLKTQYRLELGQDSFLINTKVKQYKRLNMHSEMPTVRWINNVIKRQARYVGIDKNISSHTGRVTVINMLLDQGENIRSVRDFARHKSIQTTEIYERNLNNIKDNLSLKVNIG